MKYRYHLFEDGGFSARVLVTRMGELYRLDLWTSDLNQFTEKKDPAPESADAWLIAILRGVRATGAGALLFSTSPQSSHSFFLPPEQPNTQNAQD